MYVVYGSQSRLLAKTVDALSGTLVRIYHQSVPKPRQGAYDISNSDELPGVLEILKAKYGRLGIVFIGAAFVAENKLFASLNRADIDRSLATNITNYVTIIHSVIPVMVAERYGRLVFISSFRSQNPTRGIALYSAAKAFGERFFSTLGVEYGRLGITSCILRLGYFDGRMVDELSENQKQEIISKISLRRLGQGDDLRRAIDFVVENEYLNGGVIDIQGGIDFF